MHTLNLSALDNKQTNTLKLFPNLAAIQQKVSPRAAAPRALKACGK